MTALWWLTPGARGGMTRSHRAAVTLERPPNYRREGTLAALPLANASVHVHLNFKVR